MGSDVEHEPHNFDVGGVHQAGRFKVDPSCSLPLHRPCPNLP
jgi:hypothetical protein